MKITPTSLTINQLLGSANEQYVIPAYQRRYSWHEKQLFELLDDIDLLESSDTHLLGSIVCLTLPHTAGLNTLELVDGQQRLTTVSILLQCIQDLFQQRERPDEAQEVSRLLTAKALGAPPVREIALDSLDAQAFEGLVRAEVIPGNTDLSHAFEICRKWVIGRDMAGLTQFLYRLINQVVVIRLEVNDAKDAFKLFETINNRGLRLSPTDIIKNFLLGNAARFGEEPLAQARAKWAALILSLDGVNFETFFRQFLSARLKRRITKSFVIAHFKKVFMQEVAEASSLPDRHWYLDEEEGAEDADDEADDVEDAATDESELPPEPPLRRISFSAFLEQLVSSATIYGQIVRADTGSVPLDRRLRNLKLIKSVQTYGFLMHLRAGGCSDHDFEQILALTEAFLLRRHVCRMRSNETETAFARLCATDCSNPLPEVRVTYRGYSPSDERFKEEFATTRFIPGLLERARYCLEQFEILRQGEHLELLVGGPDDVHFEHIIPRKIKTKRRRISSANGRVTWGPTLTYVTQGMCRGSAT
jgi:hypothetical protein